MSFHKGKARKKAIEIYMNVFGKRPGKEFDPFLDLLNETEYAGIKRAAKAEDKLFLMKGLIQGAKDHYRKYGVLMKKYDDLRKNANNNLKELEKANNIIAKLSNWIKNKCEKVLKKRSKILKIELKREKSKLKTTKKGASK